jgi:23S rRNA (pseudouridine1915-N3)-methyltransferase
MRWQIIAVGKPKLAFVAEGIREYVARIQPFAPLAVSFVKSGPREGESLRAQSRDAFRIVLDERGELVTSADLAARLTQWELRAVKRTALLIGGAEGHDDLLRSGADWIWSLSPLTLQHELALLVALEQLYRAYTIKSGLPYHRAANGGL